MLESLIIGFLVGSALYIIILGEASASHERDFDRRQREAREKSARNGTDQAMIQMMVRSEMLRFEIAQQYAATKPPVPSLPSPHKAEPDRY